VLLVLTFVSVSSSSASATSENCEQYPRVVIGCWQLLERNQDESAAVETLQAYMASGFHHFDTADIYGPSEKLLGRAGAKHVFTKYVTDRSSMEAARQTNFASRKDLGMVPDLVQFHWWEWADPGYRQAAQHLFTLKGEGLVGDVAACNFDVEHLRQLIVDDRLPMSANQVQYSLLDLRPENGMLAFAKEHGIRLACFGAVAGGLLSDRYLGAPASSLRMTTVSLRMYSSSLDRWTGGDWDLFQELLRALRAVADRHGTSIANVAICWVLRQLGKQGGWVVLGVRDREHLPEHKELAALLAASGGESPIDDDDEAHIRQILRRGNAPKGDIWGYERGLV